MTSDGQRTESSKTRAIWLIVLIGLVVVIGVVVAAVFLLNGASGDGAGGATSTTGSVPALTASPRPGETGQLPQPTQAPTDMESIATAVPGVTVALSSLEAVQGEGSGVGEVSGPAIRFSVDISNSTDAAVDLSTTVVLAYYGPDQVPAGPVSGPGAAALPTSLEAGGTARGTYVFTVPADQRDHVRITVDYRAGVPAIVFDGEAPQ